MNIIILGADGSGKSTLSKLIKSKLINYDIVNLKKNKSSNFFLDTLIVDFFEKLENKYVKIFYLYTILHFTEYIRNIIIIFSQNNIIFDRHPIDRLAIAIEGLLNLKKNKSIFYSLEVFVRIIWAIPNLIFLVSFDKFFFLNRSDKEIFNSRRDDYIWIEKVINKKKSYVLIYKFISKFKKNVYIINNNSSIEQLQLQIKNIL
jgi:thymidylate kinase